MSSHFVLTEGFWRTIYLWVVYLWLIGCNAYSEAVLMTLQLTMKLILCCVFSHWAARTPSQLWLTRSTRNPLWVRTPRNPFRVTSPWNALSVRTTSQRTKLLFFLRYKYFSFHILLFLSLFWSLFLLVTLLIQASNSNFNNLVSCRWSVLKRG